jgi:cyclomaltodextrinase / maltogenic alpha-amylase / neopullulanase
MGRPARVLEGGTDRVPDEFLLLDEAIPRDPDYHEGAFTMHYHTTLYGTLREIGSGRKPASAVLDALEDAARVGFQTAWSTSGTWRTTTNRATGRSTGKMR